MVEIHYTIESSKIQKDTTLAICSDLHFSTHTNEKKLTELLQRLTKEKPDIILLIGDFIDSTNELEHPEVVSCIQHFLQQLTSIAPVVSCYGNHDIRAIKNYKDVEDSADKLQKVWVTIPHVYLLKDHEMSLKNLAFFDFFLPLSYYENKRDQEDKALFLKYAQQRKRPQTNQFTILLCHSPVYIHTLDLNGIDLILSGHMHHGLIPACLNSLWKSDRGLISPYKRLFPKYTRDMVFYPTPHLISGGFTKIGPSNVLHSLNVCWASHIEYIHLKNKS